MPAQRQHLLAGLLAFLVVLTAAVLFDVIGTVFFAVTVAYLLVPAHARLVDRGVPPRVASGLATVGASVAAMVPLGAVLYLAYRRREGLLALVASLPEVFRLELAGFAYTVRLQTIRDAALVVLQDVAAGVVRAVPVLALKFGLFVIVVFALLVRRGDVASAMLAPVPDRYHDVVHRFHERTRETLFAIYVLQVVTGIGTFLLAVPTFYLLGYDYVVTLAFVAGALQFLPIIGPSALVVALGAYEVSVGATVDAVVVLAVGIVVIATLPDLLIRPRFADKAARLPGSLYYVGFVGGLLTIGPVGIVAGPLVVALLVEAADLLAAANG